MATSKKSAAPAVAKEAPAASAKPAVKAVAVAAKPAVPKAAPAPVAAKKVAAKAAPKAAAKAPAVAKPVAVKAAAPVAKPKAPAKAKAKVRSADIDPGQRANYIEVAAFYIAERRGFAPGNPEQDYLEAAAEIDRLIDAGHFGK
jgi:hypothetical protein